MQIYFVRDKYLRSLLLHGEQAIAGQLEKHVLKPMLAILTIYMETRLLMTTELINSQIRDQSLFMAGGRKNMRGRISIFGFTKGGWMKFIINQEGEAITI